MRRLAELRPTQWVLLAFTIGALGVLALTGVALVGTANAQGDLRALRDRIVPSQEHLGDAHTYLLSSQASFATALGASTIEARAAAAAESEHLANHANKRWEAYRGVSLGGSGERRLQGDYERAALAARDAGVRLFSVDPLQDPAAYESARGRYDQEAAAQVELLSRLDSDVYAPLIRHDIFDVAGDVEDARRNVQVAFGVIAVLGLGVTLLAYVDARRVQRTAARQESRLTRERHRSDLETELQRGLEMEPSEETTYRVIAGALRIAVPQGSVEMLVADSSRAHFHQVLTSDASDFSGCPVGAPRECPAASSGQTRVFPSSARLDACPYLRDRSAEPISAVCVPVSIAGATIGVFHTTASVDAPPADAAQELELVARKAGDRIGMLRVLSRTETEAQIDALTGLVNRRTVEHEGRQLIADGSPFVVVFADLDHFKDLNDKHGHEAGDRALRLFARVARDSVRPNDIPARYGGEEFVVLLPDCVVPDARVVAERLRERLAAALASAEVPDFTVSLGIAPWEPGDALGQTIARADAALLHAKRAGRDQVVVSSEVPLGPEPDAAGAVTP